MLFQAGSHANKKTNQPDAVPGWPLRFIKKKTSLMLFQAGSHAILQKTSQMLFLAGSYAIINQSEWIDWLSAWCCSRLTPTPISDSSESWPTMCIKCCTPPMIRNGGTPAWCCSRLGPNLIVYFTHSPAPSFLFKDLVLLSNSSGKRLVSGPCAVHYTYLNYSTKYLCRGTTLQIDTLRRSGQVYY